MKIVGRTGADILLNRIVALEKEVAELQENFQAMRQVLEIIREAVVGRSDDKA
jgi:hypothetical protein